MSVPKVSWVTLLLGAAFGISSLAGSITCVSNPTPNDCDLGLVGYAINVDGAVLAPVNSPMLNPYTYQQLVFGGINGLGITFDSHLTLGEVLGLDEGPPDNGTLNYNFPLAGIGASGSFAQTSALPPFPAPGPVPDPLPGIGPGMPVGLMATTVSGNVCNGDNSVGASINLDPTDALQVFQTILGCDTVSGLVDGIATFSTSTVTLTFGSIGSTSYSGEVTVTTWLTDAGPQSNPASAPEPAGLWLSLSGGVAMFAWRRFRRAA